MTQDGRLLLTDEAVARAAVRLVEAGRAARAIGRRHVLGIAGVPGSGKSTLAQRLTDAANRERAGSAVYAPMDGFHLSNVHLREEGWTQRKGAPFTYDAKGYRAMLGRYRQAVEVGPVPVYCRRVHAPVESESPVTADAEVIIAEGQYLLLSTPPWSDLAHVLDETWWLDTPQRDAERWTIRRHIAVGRSPQEAREKYEDNDGLNSRLVTEDRRKPDRVVAWPAQTLED